MPTPGYSEEYDLKSIMHYDGIAFATQEALASGEFAIVDKKTGVGLVVNAPRLSSVGSISYWFCDYSRVWSRFTPFKPIPDRI